YINSDQWRYEGDFDELNPASGRNGEKSIAKGHTADLNIRAVRNGWLPFYPQFKESSLDIPRQAEAAGAKTPEEMIRYTVDRLKDRSLKFAIEDPDAEENWPRVWYIWR